MTHVFLTPEQHESASAMSHNIGRRLRAEREARRESQLQVARAIGGHQTTVSRVERGQTAAVQVATLAKMCDRYGLRLVLIARPEGD